MARTSRSSQSQDTRAIPTPPSTAANKYRPTAQTQAEANNKERAEADAQRTALFDGLITAVNVASKVWPHTDALLKVLNVLRNDAVLGAQVHRAATLCTRLLECLCTIDQQFHGNPPPALAGFVDDFHDKLEALEQCVDGYTRAQRWWMRIARNTRSLDKIAALEAEMQDLLQYTHFTYSIYASGLSDVAVVEQEEQVQDERTIDDLREEALHPVSPEAFRHAVLLLAKRYEAQDEPDYFEAIFWYKFLAERDKEAAATAMTAIGNILQYGKGDYMCNYVEARKYYDEAFKLGDYTAMTRIGRMYLEGKLSDAGVAREYIAIECLHKALQRDGERQVTGDVEALSLIGQMHEARAGESTTAGGGDDESQQQHQLVYLREAEDVYYEGVELGNAMCVTQLTALYQRFENMGLVVDYRRRKRLTEVRNDLEHNDDPRILVSAALSILNTGSRAVVRELLEKALRHGHRLAACYLGKLEELSGNLRSAEEYFGRSARAQCPEGLRCLGTFLLKHHKELVWQNDRTEEDCVKKAVRSLETAVRYGDGLSAFYLGNFHINKNTAEGKTEGIKWFREGIRLKEPECMVALCNVCLEAGPLQDLAYAIELGKAAYRAQSQIARLMLGQWWVEGVILLNKTVLVPKDRRRAKSELLPLVALPDDEIKPILRIEAYVFLACAVQPEYPDKRGEYLTASQKQAHYKEAVAYLLQGHDAFHAYRHSASSQGLISTSQPQSLLADDDDCLRISNAIVKNGYSMEVIHQDIYEYLIKLVVSDVADDCERLRVSCRANTAFRPSAAEVASIWNKFRTAADLAYMGAVEARCVPCMIVLGWLCRLRIPDTAQHLPEFAEMLRDYRAQYSRSYKTWWLEKPFESVRCQNRSLADNAPCNTIRAKDYADITINIYLAFTSFSQAFRYSEDGAWGLWLWLEQEGYGSLTLERKVLCAECEPQRGLRQPRPVLFLETCSLCDHKKSHHCPRQAGHQSGETAAEDDDDHEESPTTWRELFLYDIHSLLRNDAATPAATQPEAEPEPEPEPESEQAAPELPAASDAALPTAAGSAE
ncbi:hypothetical protein RI367_005735 [Sorochytrium milnesiophthora]